PSLASTRASACPMPLDAPVMTPRFAGSVPAIVRRGGGGGGRPPDERLGQRPKTAGGGRAERRPGRKHFQTRPRKRGLGWRGRLEVGWPCPWHPRRSALGP